MKSVKPGRGTSLQGLIGAIVAVIFGIFWTVMAFSLTQDLGGDFGGAGAFSWIFPCFGLIFIGLGIFQIIYHFINLKNKERMSIIDIVDSEEEHDPLEKALHPNEQGVQKDLVDKQKFSFCPYCGARLNDGFTFCPKCGKEL